MPAPEQDAYGQSIPNWGPGSKLVSITPGDSTDLTASRIRAIYVGGAGDISITALNDTNPVVLPAVPAGTILPIMPKYIRSTGTTATSIVGIGG